MRSWAILGSDGPIVYSKHNIGGKVCNLYSTICFSMCGLSAHGNFFQFTYTPFIAITHHGVYLSMKFGFYKPIKF
jgi:hypothetical protein